MLSNDPDDILEHNLFAALGRYIWVWARVENNLDYLIALILVFDKENDLEEEIPKSLKRKIRFIKKSAKDNPLLKRQKNKILDFVNRINSHKNTRHTLVHGEDHLKKPREKGEATLIRIIGRGEDARIMEHKTDTLKILKSAVLVAKLANDLAQFNLKLMKRLKSGGLSDAQIRARVLHYLPILKAYE